jgi:acid phosphatase type 7
MTGGRVSENRENFWPTDIVDEASPSGAPLLRSPLFRAAVGNHDIAARNLENYPDGLDDFVS